MFRRRIASAALLLALVGVACAGHDKSVQVLGESFSRSEAPPSTSTSTTVASSAPTSSTTTTPVAPPTEAEASAPAPTEPETTVPSTGTITVKYQPHDGGSATATLEETGDTKPLESGSAVFPDLPEGTYTVHVTIEQPGTDPSTGTATYINRSRPIGLRGGDQAVVECDDAGCSTAVL